MVEGIFLRECKNRFLCEVEIENGEIVECYVPSSCRLSNFADFGGCPVLLTENTKKATRTQYALYSVRYQRSHVLLNLKETNRIVAENLQSRRFSYLGDRKIVLRENWLDDYKYDLYLPNTETVIEIKSILSLEKSQKLPVIHSERALRQLGIMSELLQKGYKVYYLFITMNSKTGCLYFENDGSVYSKLLLENIKRGMICKAYSVRIRAKQAVLNREIELRISEKTRV